MKKQVKSSVRHGRPFRLREERLGPLPIINHFLKRLGLERLLEKHVPTTDKRCTLPYTKGLGVLVRSIIAEREPIYRHDEVVRSSAPGAYGLTGREVEALRDDQLGRALDQLFQADRGTLLTDMVVTAGNEFDIRFDELHNDSTSIRFTGQYYNASGRPICGKRGPRITFGHSKDHRPDLKQLLFILTTSRDGGLPVHFRCEDGNINDSTTHIQTWEALRRIAGKADFLYVADSKLCSNDPMRHIDGNGGRFVTVLPRSRKEDALFRRWIQKNTPEWQLVWDRPNRRRKYGPRDRWYAYRHPVPSQEAWPVTWVYSPLLALHHKKSRLERVTTAKDQLEDLDKRLSGIRPRVRSRRELGKKVDDILTRLKVKRYIRFDIWQETVNRFKQMRRGRPGTDTPYRKLTKHRLRIRWSLDQETIEYDEKSDGMYPLLTNDRTLTPEQILQAHKRQPDVEKRFEQAKTVHEIAPVLLKNEGRIEALFFLYFIALLTQALIERQIRTTMKDSGIEELAVYPEDRQCRAPTCEQILRIFSTVEKHALLRKGTVVQTFAPKLTPVQKEVLKLLSVPKILYA